MLSSSSRCIRRVIRRCSHNIRVIRLTRGKDHKQNVPGLVTWRIAGYPWRSSENRDFIDVFSRCKCRNDVTSYWLSRVCSFASLIGTFTHKRCWLNTHRHMCALPNNSHAPFKPWKLFKQISRRWCFTCDNGNGIFTKMRSNCARIVSHLWISFVCIALI